MSAHIEADDRERVERERKEAQRRQEGSERGGLREDEMWRLDAPVRFGQGRGGKVAELIDDRGKVSPREALLC